MIYSLKLLMVAITIIAVVFAGVRFNIEIGAQLALLATLALIAWTAHAAATARHDCGRCAAKALCAGTAITLFLSVCCLYVDPEDFGMLDKIFGSVLLKSEDRERLYSLGMWRERLAFRMVVASLLSWSFGFAAALTATTIYYRTKIPYPRG